MRGLRLILGDQNLRVIAAALLVALGCCALVFVFLCRDEPERAILALIADHVCVAVGVGAYLGLCRDLAERE